MLANINSLPLTVFSLRASISLGNSPYYLDSLNIILMIIFQVCVWYLLLSGTPVDLFLVLVFLLTFLHPAYFLIECWTLYVKNWYKNLRLWMKGPLLQRDWFIFASGWQVGWRDADNPVSHSFHWYWNDSHQGSSPSEGWFNFGLSLLFSNGLSSLGCWTVSFQLRQVPISIFVSSSMNMARALRRSQAKLPSNLECPQKRAP